MKFEDIPYTFQNLNQTMEITDWTYLWSLPLNGSRYCIYAITNYRKIAFVVHTGLPAEKNEYDHLDFSKKNPTVVRTNFDKPKTKEDHVEIYEFIKQKVEGIALARAI